MTKSIVIALAGAVLAIAPGVSYATPRAGDVAAPAAPAAQAPADAKKKYCAVEALTGSHLRTRSCMTREEWIKAYDFDPAKK